MAYIINKYNGEQIAVVQDGTMNSALPIRLIGKDYAGFGEAQNENLVFLLENFANQTAPTSSLVGQLWYDKATSTLRYTDGYNWKGLASSWVSGAEPTDVHSLVIGDQWWDSENDQLKVYNGEQFVLVGPQNVGTNITQMRSKVVREANDLTRKHYIIEAVANGITAYVISTDSVFELHANDSIPGFSTIQQGITLNATNNPNYPGITQGNYRFWGTATNSLKLDGHAASDFIQSSNPLFNSVVHFSDTGLTVGGTNESTYKLKIAIASTVPTISNMLDESILFRTTVAGIAKYPLKLYGTSILPGSDSLVTDIGSLAYSFKDVYASTFNGIATKADTIKVGSDYKSTSIDVVADTIPVRTNTTGTYTITQGNATLSYPITTGSIKANFFVGTATQSIALKVGDIFTNASVTAESNTVVVRTANTETIDSVDTGAGSIKANSFIGVATKAVNIRVPNAAGTGFDYRLASTAANEGTIAVRTLIDDTVNDVPKGSLKAIVFVGTATQAYYADLAEKYLADEDYEVGTVVMIGGDSEVTAAEQGYRALGTVSANPAFKMNSELEGGTYIALKGRVPVKVIGAVTKGDRLIVSSTLGVAEAVSKGNPTPLVFAIALETSTEYGVKIVEAVVL